MYNHSERHESTLPALPLLRKAGIRVRNLDEKNARVSMHTILHDHPGCTLASSIEDNHVIGVYRVIPYWENADQQPRFVRQAVSSMTNDYLRFSDLVYRTYA